MSKVELPLNLFQTKKGSIICLDKVAVCFIKNQDLVIYCNMEEPLYLKEEPEIQRFNQALIKFKTWELTPYKIPD